MMKGLTSFILAALLSAALLAQAQEKPIDVILKMSDDTTKVNELLDASYKISDSSLPLADSLLDEAIRISDKTGYEFGLARAYNNRALYFNRKNEYKTALEWFEKSRELFRRLGKTKKEYGVLHGEGNAYYHLGDYQKSDSLFKIILNYAEQHGDTTTLTATLHSLALSYEARAMFAEALKLVLRSASIREQANNKKMLATDYNTIGSLLKKQKRYKESINYLKAGLKLAQETKSTSTEETILTNLGNAYKSAGDYKNAMKMYRQSMAIQSSKASGQLALSYQTISTLFHSMNYVDSAFFYARKSLQVSSEQSDERMMAINYYNMAEWMLDSSDVAGSQQQLDSANLLATRTDYKELLVSIKELQAQIHAKKNNMKEAYSELRQSIAIKDSVYGIEMSKQLNELMAKYETEKKENEIVKLNSEKLLDAEKIARQKTLNYSLLSIAGLIFISGGLIFRNVQKKRAAEKQLAVLEKQNAIESMRSKIASDVHDDMGANLTKLGLNAQQLLSSASVPEKEKQMLEKISAQSNEVITGMREIIWASNPANDNLKSMLGFMRQYIHRFFDGTDIRPVINFPHDIGEVTLHPEVRRNLFLILKESLNNAVKYSGSDKVDIDFNNENENYTLNIKDYGKGLDNNASDHFSNGMRNMEMRAQQIQSVFSMNTSPGQGVQISVSGKLY